MTTVARSAEPDAVRQEVEQLGGDLGHWLDATHAVLEIEDRRLVELARLRDVMQVELATRWSSAAEPDGVD